MPKGPIRRGQLIAPFGVGAMTVVQDGTSVISGGLDHWFEREGEGGEDVFPDEYKIEEWRLQRLLQADHFRLPPDYRLKHYGEETPNTRLTVPFLRFPKWNFCRMCNKLEESPLSLRGKPDCKRCGAKGRTRYLVQVPFVTMCDKGHLQDFPWREWVHRARQASCQQDLSLIATGGATLAAQSVRCECGARRSLASINEASPDGNTTFLSDNLDKDKQSFACQGKRPWLGTDEGEICGRPLRGSLRSASNVYFAHIRSSIYLPRGSDSAPSELVATLEGPPLSTLISVLKQSQMGVTPEILRGQQAALLEGFSDVQLEAAIQIILSEEDEGDSGGIEGDDPETAFRRAEYETLRVPRGEEQLLIKEASLGAYEPGTAQLFSRIMLIEKLRETRVLSGFSRVFPEDGRPLDKHRRMLRRRPPQTYDWLPAYIIYGEGIFLELAEDRLQQWEEQSNVVKRIQPLVQRFQELQQARRLQDALPTPRLVLLHTFAHIVMNQLIFECGYSSASLRERLYVSNERSAPMAGILIYTAAGDAEGTMGGLVRMGKPGYLEPIIRRALEGAQWCSADPVCMETGSSGGQGPDSCNLAACHNCALVPETACEKFNRLLDRGLLTGGFDHPELGFFPPSDGNGQP